MAYVTLADLAAFTDSVYSLEEGVRLAGFLDAAERWVWRAGWHFDTATARTTREAQDFIEVVTLIAAQRWRLATDAAALAAITGPYLSERLPDYSYTLKADWSASLLSDPRVAEIIEYWAPNSSPGTLQQGPITYRTVEE